MITYHDMKAMDDDDVLGDRAVFPVPSPLEMNPVPAASKACERTITTMYEYFSGQKKNAKSI